MTQPTLGIIGAGQIGGTLAHLGVLRQLGHIVLLDLAPGICRGKALDLSHIAYVENKDVTLTGTNDYSDLVNCDVVIVTAGLARRPGMTRDDLLEKNASIVYSIGKKLRQFCPQAFVIMITNPLDVMVWVMQEATGFSAHQVVGMAGILDSARFASFLAQELCVCIEDIQTMILGGHGDAMVPLVRYTTVAGIPVSEWVAQGQLTQERLDALIQRTRNGGAEIVDLLQNGSAFYAPATCALTMAESYLKNRRRIFSCSTRIEDLYGLDKAHVAVPLVLGAKGVERVIELSLTTAEQEALHRSAAEVQRMIDRVKLVP